MNKSLCIAICDDDFKVLDALESMINKYSEENNISITTGRFLSGEELLAVENLQEAYEIIFIDVYLHPDSSGLTGTEAVRRLKLSKAQQVVFMTTSREHAVEAFSLNAAHYLMKSLDYSLVKEAIKRCIERIGADFLGTLEIKTKHGTLSVPTGNITYIEVSNKQSTIHTAKSSYETYTSLDSLYEMLDEKMFMRAQRSFVVNMHYIDELLFDRIILTDKTEITLSRNNRAALKKQYQNFLFDLARRNDI